MENKLQIFNHAEFGKIRTISEEGATLFCGNDVAKSLGYSNPRKALSDHCKGVTKRDTPTESGTQPFNFIPEGDVYRLIVRSKMPAAEKFERWVFDEIVPSVVNTGSYGTNESAIHQMETLLHGFIAVVEQMGIVTANLAQITSDLTKAQPQQAAATVGQAIDESFVFGDNCCKLERAPQQLRVQVDAMLHKMMDEQSMNFSAIARFCLLNGFSISSPAVRTYYERVFMERAV